MIRTYTEGSSVERITRGCGEDGTYGDENQRGVHYIEQHQSLFGSVGAAPAQELAVEFRDDKGKDKDEQLLKADAGHVNVNPWVKSASDHAWHRATPFTSQDFRSCLVFPRRGDSPSGLDQQRSIERSALMSKFSPPHVKKPTGFPVVQNISQIARP